MMRVTHEKQGGCNDSGSTRASREGSSALAQDKGSELGTGVDSKASAGRCCKPLISHMLDNTFDNEDHITRQTFAWSVSSWFDQIANVLEAVDCGACKPFPPSRLTTERPVALRQRTIAECR